MRAASIISKNRVLWRCGDDLSTSAAKWRGLGPRRSSVEKHWCSSIGLGFLITAIWVCEHPQRRLLIDSGSAGARHTRRRFDERQPGDPRKPQGTSGDKWTTGERVSYLFSSLEPGISQKCGPSKGVYGDATSHFTLWLSIWNQ